MFFGGPDNSRVVPSDQVNLYVYIYICIFLHVFQRDPKTLNSVSGNAKLHKIPGPLVNEKSGCYACCVILLHVCALPLNNTAPCHKRGVNGKAFF